MKGVFMRRKVLIVSVVLMLIMVLCACSLFTSTTKLTPKQQASVWFSIYNQTYDDTMATMKNPASTQSQKDVAQKKKAIMTQVWPLLKVYAVIVDGGGTPTTESQAAITSLFNELTSLATGGQ
jgi:hypothetical protein